MRNNRGLLSCPGRPGLCRYARGNVRGQLVNGADYAALVFGNGQAHFERPPAYVYSNVFNGCARKTLRSDGAVTGAVGDLNGDGYDDLVLGMQKNGISLELNAFVYFGSPEGLTERYHIELPAPVCTSIAIGDFNGDDRADLALITKKRLRIFYQTELGLQPKRYVDLPIGGGHIAAADLDGDGFADLYLLSKDQPPRVFWGGPEGIDVEFKKIEYDGRSAYFHARLVIYAPEDPREIVITIKH